jgi:hypothetical protein
MKRYRYLAIGAALAAAFGLVTIAEPPTAYAQAKGKALAGTGSGTLKGKVTLDGDAAAKKLNIDPNHKDAGHCAKGDTEDRTWVVGPNKGLANVVVFLKPPPGYYLKVDTAKKTWPDEVSIDQPFCNFNPHVSVVFAEYEGKPSGQKFVIKNSAPILHNSRVQGGAFRNPAKNYTLAAGKDQPHQFKADTQVIKVNCDAHKWMEAYIWAFDHPYAAVTGPDGSFEIKNVPTGVDLSVMAWHEIGTKPAGDEVKKGPVKDGDNLEITIKKK